MFRMWGKIVEDNRLQQDCVSRQDDETMSRTQKVLQALKEICEYFDLAVPIWLEKNISEFKRTSKTGFDQDNFIEFIPFDRLEIEVIEE